jgi:hypothetical protein
MAEPAGRVIEQFFVSLTARDWEALGRVLAPQVERIGPFGDQVVGRDRYLDLLMRTVPSEYRNDVLRITSSPDGRSGFARVTEHLQYPHQELHLEETYCFDLDQTGLLSRIEIFWQTPESDPGGFGSATSDESYRSSGAAGPDSSEVGPS